MSETLWILRLLSVAFVQMFLAKTSQATEDDYYNEDYSYYDRDDGELIKEHFSEWHNCAGFFCAHRGHLLFLEMPENGEFFLTFEFFPWVLSILIEFWGDLFGIF